MITLDEALDYLSDIEHINSGGCGVAALAIGRLAQNNGVRSKVKYKFINEYETYNEAPYRVYCIVGDRPYDPAGGALYNPDEIEFEADEDQLVQCLNGKQWNHWFDREVYVPEIESYLDIDLSDIRR